jgi:trigger factor
MAHQHDENCNHDHDHEPEAGQDQGPTVTAVMEDLGPCKKLLKVEVGADEVKKEITVRIDEIRRGVSLKGFRKGKAPRDRIEALYGDSVRKDARDHLLRAGYVKALQSKIEPEKVLGEGTIENVAFSSDGALKFEVTLHTRPEFELGDHKGVEVKIAPAQVEDKDVEAALERFRSTRGDMRPVEGADAVVEAEDLLAVDAQVWLADEHERWAQAKEGGDAAQTGMKPLKEHFGLDVQLPGTTIGPFEIEDLKDSLVGLKVGEWGDAETDLPADYEVVEGRNEPAVLRMQVQAIKRLVRPELTEEWVKESGYGSIADLRREIREELQQRLEVIRRQEVELKVLAALNERTGQFALPGDLVDKEIENAERRRFFELRMGGKDEATAKAEVETERDTIRREVERMLRYFFIMDIVAKRENVKVSERDVDARIARMAAQRRETPQKIREELEKHEVMGQVRHDLMEEKTRGILREHAKVVEASDD